MPTGRVFEVVKLFIRGIAHDTRFWMSFGRRQNNLSQAGEVDLGIEMLGGE